MRSVAAILTLVACVHAGLWALLQRQVSVPEFRGQLASISYSPYTRGQNPDRGDRPTADQIRADLKRISPYTRAIRTYSSTGGQELIPGIAAEFGLKVTLGIWLDIPHDGMSEARKREVIARNEREIRAGLELARRYSNITAIAVGNETTLRVMKSEHMTAEQSVAELVKLIQIVKRQSPVPVTTGEIWTVWRDNPELASAVDFIGAHILPYWEGVPERAAAEDALVNYNKLRQIHPGK